MADETKDTGQEEQLNITPGDTTQNDDNTDVGQNATDKTDNEEAENKEEAREETTKEVKDIEPEVREGVSFSNKEEASTEEDEEIDPDDKKVISKIIDEKVAGRVATIENKIEVDNYISQNPEMSKYRQVMLKYAQHPAYKNIPIRNIAAIVAANDLVRMGAEKEREAQAKAAATKDGSNSTGMTASNKVDWSTASVEEVENEIARIKGIKR